MNRALCAALIAVPAVAHADTPLDRPEAIDVDRDMTPPGQAEHGFDGGAPIGTWALGLELGYLDRPLRFHTVELETYPVDHRETARVGGAFAVGDSVIVDARLPLSHQIGARYQGFGDDRPLDRWVMGDLVLGARLRVVERGGVSVFLRGELALPSGGVFDFEVVARWSGAWMCIARIEVGHGVVLSGTGGIRLRGEEVQVADQLVGDELVWGLGATVEIPPFIPLYCKPDQLKAMAEVVGVVGDDVDHQHGPSPVEGRLGVIGRVRPQYAIAVRVGTHLDDQIGAPTFRASIDLVYQPSPTTHAHAAPATPATDDESDEP